MTVINCLTVHCCCSGFQFSSCLCVWKASCYLWHIFFRVTHMYAGMRAHAHTYTHPHTQTHAYTHHVAGYEETGHNTQQSAWRSTDYNRTVRHLGRTYFRSSGCRLCWNEQICHGWLSVGHGGSCGDRSRNKTWNTNCTSHSDTSQHSAFYNSLVFFKTAVLTHAVFKTL